MRPIFIFCIALVALKAQCQEKTTGNIELKTANGHPMQYFISLPEGWNKKQQWPIVLVIESADKAYKENMMRFVKARKNMPFILVAPYNVNNSRSGRRDPTVFPYSSKVWDMIEQVGDCKFNLDGITQIVKDVQQAYNGEQKYFITGFEAGAHTVWQLLFQHPERLKAAAPVAGNYNQNSCMEASLFSTDSSRINLPVRGFSGDQDQYYGKNSPVYFQWQNAAKEAGLHGYKNISETIVAGKGHVPMPEEVLNWFYTFLKKDRS